MRKRNQMKKGIAALLSGVLAFGMTAGVIPGFEDSMQSVRAATSEPSVTAYATKTQMMDGTFATRNETGTAANIGVLAFGKNRAQKTQEWYILGKDKNVDGENTVIFTVKTELFLSQYKITHRNIQRRQMIEHIRTAMEHTQQQMHQQL